MQIDLGKDFFEIFGLRRNFDIDVADLAVRYRELQRGVHPDKFSQSPDSERRLSLQLAAHFNEAFQTLKDPLKRARYLLHLSGIDTDEETDTFMDPGFLGEQMELREALEEALHAPNRDSVVSALAHDVEERLRQKIQMVGDAFEQNTSESLQRCRALVREMQFLEKVLRELRETEDMP